MHTLNESHQAAMRRAGLALAVIGLLDIAVCATAVVRGGSYSSSFNIFALIAGVLVYRGHMGAGRFVFTGLSFLLGGFLLAPLLVSALTPPRLLWLQLEHYPWQLLGWAIFYLVFMSTLYWIRQTLATVPLHGHGKRSRPLHRSKAAALGAAIPLLLAILIPMMLRGEAGRRAVAEAERKVGPGYSFHVQRLSTSGRSGSAVVVAYSDSEIRHVAVEWKD